MFQVLKFCLVWKQSDGWGATVGRILWSACIWRGFLAEPMKARVYVVIVKGNESGLIVQVFKSLSFTAVEAWKSCDNNETAFGEYMQATKPSSRAMENFVCISAWWSPSNETDPSDIRWEQIPYNVDDMKWFGFKIISPEAGRALLVKWNLALKPFSRMPKRLNHRINESWIHIESRGDIDINSIDCDRYPREEGSGTFMLFEKYVKWTFL